MATEQISWTEHKLHIADATRKRSHHQIKKRRSTRDERWKRSGAMTSHHGCDEHYKRRTCPGCQGDEARRCGSGYGGYQYRCMFEEDLQKLPYVARRTDGRKIQYVDKDLGTVYYEKTIPTKEESYWGSMYNSYDYSDDDSDYW